jgi:hypothetical protein
MDKGESNRAWFGRNAKIPSFLAEPRADYRAALRLRLGGNDLNMLKPKKIVVYSKTR